jgi:subtilisin family serine protease
VARGIDVDVPWKDGGTMRTTGNSFAAPHIAGIAALIRSKHPELRPFQVKTVLWATAANVRDARQGVPVAGRLSRVTRMTTSVRATSALRSIRPPGH